MIIEHVSLFDAWLFLWYLYYAFFIWISCQLYIKHIPNKDSHSRQGVESAVVVMRQVSEIVKYANYSIQQIMLSYVYIFTVIANY